MVTEELTGRKRTRVHQEFFKAPLVVLQVEVRRKGLDMGLGPNDIVRDVDYTYWRDAQVQDVTLGVV